MLGMMMDFLRDSIDPVFAKGMLTIYNSTTSVIMGIAAVVAIAQLFQENKDSENDKEEEKPLKRRTVFGSCNYLFLLRRILQASLLRGAKHQFLR